MTSEDFAELLGSDAVPIRYNFDGHTILVALPAGEGEYPTLKFACHEADRHDYPCTPEQCQMEFLYGDIGWDVIKCETEIVLGEIKARVDWSDPEEPWIEVSDD